MSQTAFIHTAAREPGCWYGADLRDADYRLAMPAEVIEELDAASRGDAPPADANGLPATAELLRAVRRRLFRGTGIVVAGRLPVEHWGERRAVRAITVLSTLMGPPVTQNLAGTTFYPVEDKGVAPSPGVRRSLTNESQPFHSDGPWIREPAWIVGLYCVRAARVGGVTRCISLKTLFGDLARRSPELVARLEHDLYWHRQREHEAHESPVSRFPMIWHDESGRWCCRYYADYVVSGYRAAGEPVDELARRALAAAATLGAEPARAVEFRLREGEVQWINNRWCAHARSGFEGRSETDRPRFLVRVWHRDGDQSTALDA